MKTLKKLTIYDLNPLYFKDGNKDGIGDLKGLSQKLDYFKFLGVDAVLLQNILSTETNDPEQNFMKIASSLGDEKELFKIIQKFRLFGIKVFVDFKIGSINKENDWFKIAKEEKKYTYVDIKQNKDEIPMNSDYDEEYKVFYPVNEFTQEIKLDWSSDKIVNEFVKVIKFWSEMGIEGFVFKDFEFLGSKDELELMNEATLIKIRKLYSSIKEINDNIFVIGKSSIIHNEYVSMYTQGRIKIFDYFITSQTTFLGTKKKYGNDLIGKFYPHKLNKIIKKIGDNPSNIVSLGNELSGRINSRWTKSEQYNKEAAKTIALISLMSKASSTIYYSDELGAKNIGLTHLDDFNDQTLQIRKTTMLDQKVSEEKFMSAQVLQNSINGKSLMLWNKTKNAGFSENDKTITPVSIGYAYNNVKIQFNDEDSILHFYKKIIKIIKCPTMSKIMNEGTLKIGNYFISLGVIKYTFRLDEQKIIVLVNLTDKNRITPLMDKKLNVFVSTYSNKEYDEIPKILKAYESLIITKNIFNDEKVECTLMNNENKTKKVQGENKQIKSNKSKIYDEINKEDITSLKESDIAETTQIDIDDVEDIDEFLKEKK